ncbi:hypothetical protein SAY87_009911 [Trapa incisa]|uniref:TH1 domain-containing protein n=1 Tax=Trapa incisa TaxID=236973 RepID=A0AAN7GKP8_9MYRT|nr:hypothetical protein SAY87_009911 [Trapa incisa]
MSKNDNVTKPTTGLKVRTRTRSLQAWVEGGIPSSLPVPNPIPTHYVIKNLSDLRPNTAASNGLSFQIVEAFPDRRPQLSLKFDSAGDDPEEEQSLMLKPSLGNITHDQEPFMGFNVRRKDSLHCDFKGDYLDVPSHRLLTRIMQKQGDKQVLFADKVLKFTTSGKIKRRILLITDFAIYIVDLEGNALKRRIALAAVEKMHLSELSDNSLQLLSLQSMTCSWQVLEKQRLLLYWSRPQSPIMNLR